MREVTIGSYELKAMIAQHLIINENRIKSVQTSGEGDDSVPCLEVKLYEKGDEI